MTSVVFFFFAWRCVWHCLNACLGVMDLVQRAQQFWFQMCSLLKCGSTECPFGMADELVCHACAYDLVATFSVHSHLVWLRLEVAATFSVALFGSTLCVLVSTL